MACVLADICCETARVLWVAASVRLDMLRTPRVNMRDREESGLEGNGWVYRGENAAGRGCRGPVRRARARRVCSEAWAAIQCLVPQTASVQLGRERSTPWSHLAVAALIHRLQRETIVAWRAVVKYFSRKHVSSLPTTRRGDSSRSFRIPRHGAIRWTRRWDTRCLARSGMGQPAAWEA